MTLIKSISGIRGTVGPHKDMCDSADAFSVLKDRRPAHALYNTAGLF